MTFLQIAQDSALVSTELQTSSLQSSDYIAIVALGFSFASLIISFIFNRRALKAAKEANDISEKALHWEKIKYKSESDKQAIIERNSHVKERSEIMLELKGLNPFKKEGLGNTDLEKTQGSLDLMKAHSKFFESEDIAKLSELLNRLKSLKDVSGDYSGADQAKVRDIENGIWTILSEFI
jgi:hypothetical protein